jgi:hypothetical protein
VDRAELRGVTAAASVVLGERPTRPSHLIGVPFRVGDAILDGLFDLLARRARAQRDGRTRANPRQAPGDFGGVPFGRCTHTVNDAGRVPTAQATRRRRRRGVSVTDIDDVRYWLTIERDELAREVAVVTWQPMHVALALVNSHVAVELHLTEMLRRGMRRPCTPRQLPDILPGWRMILGRETFSIFDPDAAEILTMIEETPDNGWNTWRRCAINRGLVWMFVGSAMGIRENGYPDRSTAHALGMLLTGSVEVVDL